MTKHDFSDEERYAVYTIHGEKCYMCREPLDLLSMDVDHVIPESLLDDSVKLAEVLATFGLPNDFDLQSFENWLPTCKPCNLRKGERGFDATPRIQMDLQIAREKAAKAAELAGSRVTDKSAARAWNVIKRADAAGALRRDIRSAILEFASFHAPRRQAEVADEPIHLTPLIEIISERDGMRLIKGPYGVGGGPANPPPFSNFQCPICGSVAWNGARCVVCGQLDDV